MSDSENFIIFTYIQRKSSKKTKLIKQKEIRPVFFPVLRFAKWAQAQSFFEMRLNQLEWGLCLISNILTYFHIFQALNDLSRKAGNNEC